MEYDSAGRLGVLFSRSVKKPQGRSAQPRFDHGLWGGKGSDPSDGSEVYRSAGLLLSGRGATRTPEAFLNYGRPGTKGEDLVWERLSHHDINPQLVNGRM